MYHKRNKAKREVAGERRACETEVWMLVTNVQNGRYEFYIVYVRVSVRSEAYC